MNSAEPGLWNCAVLNTGTEPCVIKADYLIKNSASSVDKPVGYPWRSFTAYQSPWSSRTFIING
jgi:hypothetical protein